MEGKAQGNSRGGGRPRGRGFPGQQQRPGQSNRGGTRGGGQPFQGSPGVAPNPRPMNIVHGIGGGDGPRAPIPSVVGRATSVSVTSEPVRVVADVGAVGEAETVAREDGRGSMRGKRVITEFLSTRPLNLSTKCGTAGSKITIQANYFRVLKKPQWSIHQYRVDFSPEVDVDRVRKAYLAHHKHIFGGYIFDGTMLFCTQHLKESQMELLTKNREEEIIQIKIKHVGIVDVTDMQLVQVLNLILRRSMEGLNLQLVGRNFFDPQAKINLSQYKLEIWPGYLTSIRQHEQDILLCCEIAHKVMRTDSIYQILRTCIQEDDNYQDAFKRRVVGSIVLTDYNNKTYRIDDVDFKTTPKSKFQTKTGEISYVDYYKQRYGITIKDFNQPMLVSRPTEKDIRGGQNEFILLVPEISRATGMTDEMRANFRLMQAMSEHTRLNPERRIERLKIFNNRLQQAKASIDVLNAWNMQLDKNLVEVPGRIFAPEKILFGNRDVYVCDANADWTREFRNRSMYAHTDIKRWYVIAPRRNIREVQAFVDLCIKAASGMKMQINNPRYEELNDDRNNSYSQAIDNAVSCDPQLLMLVLVNKNEEKYSCIKKKCCVDRPIPSQVTTLHTIAPRGNKAAGLMSVATKVVIQMNAKLRGVPWLSDFPPNNIMTVGFDVCHSAKDKNKSYAALVATMDIKRTSRYYSNVMQHMKGQELSNEISMSMTYALQAYRQEHGTLPDRILFYRDGVGDGQLHQVVNTEVKALKSKIIEIYTNADMREKCRMSFIVVSKRINTRIFHNRLNPKPGTVVDDVVTLPERYDFFLVSQSVRQGTVSPTSYNVIVDETGWRPDQIQMLTYKMTHLYYNYSGTCRVPAVCQYAHKLAFLVAESIHRNPSNLLEKQLYFL